MRGAPAFPTAHTALSGWISPFSFSLQTKSAASRPTPSPPHFLSHVCSSFPALPLSLPLAGQFCSVLLFSSKICFHFSCPHLQSFAPDLSPENSKLRRPDCPRRLHFCRPLCPSLPNQLLLPSCQDPPLLLLPTPPTSIFHPRPLPPSSLVLT